MKNKTIFPLLTEEEIKIQIALGTLPPEMKINPCRYTEVEISKGKRRCYLCGEHCIHRGDEYYRIFSGRWNTINVCMECSWLSMPTIKRIIKETKVKLNESRSNENQ